MLKTNASLESMKNVDIQTVELKDLVDIRGVKVNASLPRKERLLDYIKQIQNPYCYKCGNMVVKVGFLEGGSTIEDRLESFLLTI